MAVLWWGGTFVEIIVMLGAAWMAWHFLNQPGHRDRSLLYLGVSVVCFFFLNDDRKKYTRSRKSKERDRRRVNGECVWCGYDLRASKGKCPECGLSSFKGQR